MTLTSKKICQPVCMLNGKLSEGEPVYCRRDLVNILVSQPTFTKSISRYLCNKFVSGRWRCLDKG